MIALWIETKEFTHVIDEPWAWPNQGEFIMFEKDGVTHALKATKVTVDYVGSKVVVECYE
jgi:hypothetical protein